MEQLLVQWDLAEHSVNSLSYTVVLEQHPLEVSLKLKVIIAILIKMDIFFSYL